MIRRRSIACFARFARVVLAATAFVAVAKLRDTRVALACSGGEESISDYTTFDPGVLGVNGWEGVYFDPFHARFGGYLPTFDDGALVADWHAYLGDAVSTADWKRVLFDASTSELVAIRNKLTGASSAMPKGYERSSLWSKAAARGKLAAAIAVVELARDVEPSVAYVDPWGAKRPDLPPRLLAAALASPSTTLAWRARYYFAGALARTNQLARASLELAHIHANYPPLAGPAAGDFHPRDEHEWRDALALARTVRDKTELWRLVGVRFDGIAAIREIMKLDPSSDLIAVLVVRELARAEDGTQLAMNDPDAARKQRRAYDDLDRIARELAARRGADRPWLMDLVAGHIAALRGELSNARTWLQKALAARSHDARVASQVAASLALALSANWRIDRAHEAELADNMTSIGSSFERSATVEKIVRDRLARLYLVAGRFVDAEYLHPGIVDADQSSSVASDSWYPDDAYPNAFSPHPGKLHWADVAFITDMIARPTKTATRFDSFVTTQTALEKPRLEQELALRYALDGDFAAASRTFATTKAVSERLEVDPFVTHIKDCRVCDEENYAKATWTHATVIARLAQLAPIANGRGDTAARAAIQIGNALYNFTWYGNARRVLRATHQDTFDAHAAAHWYALAFDRAKSRELKAEAAYLSAKAERGNLIDAATEESSDLPIPTTWFGKLKQLADTRYYKDVLRECGTFARWSAP